MTYEGDYVCERESARESCLAFQRIYPATKNNATDKNVIYDFMLVRSFQSVAMLNLLRKHSAAYHDIFISRSLVVNLNASKVWKISSFLPVGIRLNSP